MTIQPGAGYTGVEGLLVPDSPPQCHYSLQLSSRRYYFIHPLVRIQPRKTGNLADMTEKILTGM